MKISKKIGTIICDANILIDYLDNCREVLKLATSYCYEIYVVRQVFDEVEQLNEKTAEELGLKIIDADISQLFEASQYNSALSHQDMLCLILARDNGWICATNEKRLFNECNRRGVSVIRGLKLMIELTQRGILTPEEAIGNGKKIISSNKHISKHIFEEFKKQIIIS